MPIYEYTCRECGEEFEHLLRGDEKPSCPACGKARLSKKFSVPAAHTGAAGPECPARDAGACGASSCPAQGCGLTGLTGLT